MKMHRSRTKIDEYTPYEDLIGYIWGFINKAGIREEVIEKDDLFQELSITWMNCQTTFMEKKVTSSSFYTYLTNSFRFRINKELRSYYSKPVLYSLDYDYSISHKPVTLTDIIEDLEHDLEKETNDEEIIYEMINHKHGRIVQLMINGHSMEEVGNILGIARQNVHANFQTLLKDVREKIL